MLILDRPPQCETPLAGGHCLLFAYGQLQPGRRPPKSSSRAWPDRVRGDLYDLGPYPAAIRVGVSPRWIHGHVLEIDERELDELDAYEEVGTGIYRRLRALTEAGFEVWVYEYARTLPASAAGPIDRWT